MVKASRRIRCHIPTTWLTATTAVLGALAIVTGQAPAVFAQEALPEPFLVVDGGPTDGQVTLSPATQSTTDPRVQWLLTNGGSDTLTFDLSIHDMTTSGGDIEVGDPRGDLHLASDTVTLAPGEVARIPLHLPDGLAPTALGLVARTAGATPQVTVTGTLLVSGSGRVTPTIVAADDRTGLLTVRLDADGPALVDVALRAWAWPGLTHADEVIHDVLVPAGGRDLEVELSGPVAGRVHVEVAVAADRVARDTAEVWWWPQPLVIALAVALVAVTALLVLATHHRRRRREA